MVMGKDYERYAMNKLSKVIFRCKKCGRESIFRGKEEDLILLKCECGEQLMQKIFNYNQKREFDDRRI